MEGKDVLTKLVSALNNLSDDDLHQLTALLAQPKANKALVKLIESTLALRYAERKSKSEIRKPSYTVRRKDREIGSNDANLVHNRLSVRSMDELKNTFVTFLEDRNLFPSTRDVVDVVNKALHRGIAYEDFRKRGRKDLIRKCWTYLTTLPRKRQIEMLKTLFYSIPKEPEGIKPYRELFKILARYE